MAQPDLMPAALRMGQPSSSERPLRSSPPPPKDDQPPTAALHSRMSIPTYIRYEDRAEESGKGEKVKGKRKGGGRRPK